MLAVTDLIVEGELNRRRTVRISRITLGALVPGTSCHKMRALTITSPHVSEPSKGDITLSVAARRSSFFACSLLEPSSPSLSRKLSLTLVKLAVSNCGSAGDGR